MARSTWLLLILACVALACGDDDSGSKLSQCEQLESDLCTRTTECAISQGLEPSADHDAFLARCHRSLSSDFCRMPADDSGDFELCSEAIKNIPCETVATFLNMNTVVAPTTSCSGYLAP
ncbi:MAG: hypothetical protein JWN48_4221 [Myxococcaceae bacterium]|nr:hypothetical protein [Myxococcaceae bacterium]